MSIFSAIIVFVLAWWICFFAVLPIGVRGQWEEGGAVPGTDEGAPARPELGKKVFWATGAAAVVTAAAALILPRLLAQ
jgi:predicted secreted protein